MLFVLVLPNLCGCCYAVQLPPPSKPSPSILVWHPTASNATGNTIQPVIWTPISCEPTTHEALDLLCSLVLQLGSARPAVKDEGD
jgi:hypothetical protein